MKPPMMKKEQIKVLALALVIVAIAIAGVVIKERGPESAFASPEDFPAEWLTNGKPLTTITNVSRPQVVRGLDGQ
jgi:hypothetical protein